MKEIVIVCEGQTEETFTNRVLGPFLADRQVFVQPRLIATSRVAKGGALNHQRVFHFLRNTLRERKDTYVTTFFDLYGLPRNFPGHSKATNSDPIERAASIESVFHAEVVQKAECRSDRFFPHIQPCEFESLLFSEISRFEEAEPSWRKFAGQLAAARQSAKSPEHVNEGSTTHPSARLKHLTPRYRKVLHGADISGRIGIPRMRAECRHFDGWMQRLEDLPPQHETQQERG